MFQNLNKEFEKISKIKDNQRKRNKDLTKNVLCLITKQLPMYLITITNVSKSLGISEWKP